MMRIKTNHNYTSRLIATMHACTHIHVHTFKCKRACIINQKLGPLLGLSVSDINVVK